MPISARDEGRGNQAVVDLSKEGLSPKFHQLDLNDTSTIEKFKEFLQQNYGGLDLLINNAGVALMVTKQPLVLFSYFHLQIINVL